MDDEERSPAPTARSAGGRGYAARVLPDRDLAGLGPTPGLPDEAFEHDGLLTKRTLRALALAHLRPAPGARLWDLGCGAGSVAIEWARAGGLEPPAEAIGVEQDPVRADRARRNAARLGVGAQVEIRCGDVDAAVSSLPRPDAVFLGGGLSSHLLERCLAALPAGGRLVAHAVTLESEATLVAALREHGGEVLRVAVEAVAPLGGRLGWRPARAIVHFSHTRGVAGGR